MMPMDGMYLICVLKHNQLLQIVELITVILMQMEHLAKVMLSTQMSIEKVTHLWQWTPILVTHLPFGMQ